MSLLVVRFTDTHPMCVPGALSLRETRLTAQGEAIKSCAGVNIVSFAN